MFDSSSTNGWVKNFVTNGGLIISTFRIEDLRPVAEFLGTEGGESKPFSFPGSLVLTWTIIGSGVLIPLHASVRDPINTRDEAGSDDEDMELGSSGFSKEFQRR
eukprot:gene36701-47840_t